MERWISADPVTANIYDPQSLNKYTFVRNDPVNLVDPDGRNPYTTGVTVWAPAYPLAPYPVNPVAYNDSSVHFSHDPTQATNEAVAIWLYTGMIGAANSRMPTATEELQSKLNMTGLLKWDLKYRAGVGNDQKGRCFDFLLKVIRQLKTDNLLAADFSVYKLIENITSATRLATTVLQLRANARTKGDVISIASDPVDPIGNDYISTLLHEGFHLQMTGIGAKIDDDKLMRATSIADGTQYRGGSTSEFNKQMFGQNCNP